MSKETPVPDVNVDELREAVREEYREVAESPAQGFHFHTGRRLAAICEYRDEWLAGIPERVIERFAGTGNPFAFAPLQPGEFVVDLGCGAGIDSFIAARQVGASGAVVGVDMTPAMLEQANLARDEMGIRNLEFRQGLLEQIPIDDGWADVVISNGAANLAPDKAGIYREMYRVLQPGGRLQIADIMVDKPVSEEAKRKIDLWTGWIAGALLEGELAAVIESVGFEGFAITWKAPVFEGAPQSSSAAKFGTVGINFKAVKPR